MNYRIKTHDELLEAGFALTPNGTYVHARFDQITPEMIAAAMGFTPTLVRTVFETPYGQRKCIDGEIYCAQHFVEEPHLKLVGAS